MRICPLHHQEDLTFQIVFSLCRHLSSLAWFLQCTSRAISQHNQTSSNDPKCNSAPHLNQLKRTCATLQHVMSAMTWCPDLKPWQLLTKWSPHCHLPVVAIANGGPFNQHETRGYISGLRFYVVRQNVNLAPSNTRSCWRPLTLLPLHFRKIDFLSDKSKSLIFFSNGTALLLCV